MIVVSKFHDYYDGFLASCRDPKIVYRRATRRIKAPEVDILVGFTRDSLWPFDDDVAFVGLVVLAGQIYPFGHSKKGGFDYKTPYRRHPRDLTNLLEARSPWPVAEYGQSHRDALAVNRLYGPVVALLPHFVDSGHFGRYRGTIVDPRLADLDFPMPVSDLATILMGFLAARDPDVSKASDAVRAQAHGMDKTSFRRDKGGPTRKRKKTTS